MVILEAVLDGGKDASLPYPEVMFWTREGAIADVLVSVAIQKIVGCQWQAHLAVDSPYSRSIKKYQIGGIPLGESGQEMLRSHSKLHIIIWNYGSKDVLPEVMIIVGNRV